jgi:hypothetical protein
LRKLAFASKRIASFAVRRAAIYKQNGGLMCSVFFMGVLDNRLDPPLNGIGT